MHEGCIRNGRLSAPAYAERVDPAEMHEGIVRDCRLLAMAHVERVDAGGQ